MSEKKHWNSSEEYKEIHGKSSSYDPKDSQSVKKIWNERAVSGKEKLPDRLQHQLELNSLLKHISSNDKVLDAGCGSGFSSRSIAKHCHKICGIDFAENLIAKAKKEPEIKNLDFYVEDIKNLSFEPRTFDKVITQRVLINLVNMENQLVAVKEIHRVLEDNGLFLMLETNKQGIENLNSIRSKFGLDPIVPPWHNKVIDELVFFDKIKSLFELVSEINLGDYFFITRVIHPMLVYPEKPSYKNKINEVAFNLSNSDLGIAPNFSQAKLYVLRKVT